MAYLNRPNFKEASFEDSLLTQKNKEFIYENEQLSGV